MVTISTKNFLLNDPLAKFDREVAKIEVGHRFNKFLPVPSSTQIIGALIPFTLEKPWKYWDPDTVEIALNCLEHNLERTVQAIKTHPLALDRGIENLFRPSKVAYAEESFNYGQSQSSQSQWFVRLATEFFPEYLRCAEHVFGNLVEIYWSIEKRGGVEGKFDFRGGIALLESKGFNRLLVGYSEKIRNAIAHGEFNFTGFNIEFGNVQPEVHSPSDFLRLFDELYRSCNALGVALLLFWERKNRDYQLRDLLPLSVVTRLAGGGLNRTGLKLLGIVESNTPLAGRQLHIAVQMSMQSRTQVLGECCRVATHLLEAGARGYDRFLIEIDHGKEVSSLAIILPKKLEELLNTDASIEQLPEIFAETQLLWFDESKLKTRLRAWQIILTAGISHTKLEILNNWRSKGLWIGKGRFHIREVELLGSQGVARLRIRAVLKNPSDAEDRQTVREIIHELVKSGKRRLIKSRSAVFDSGIAWRKFPSYVFVDLYKTDGTLRWLRGGGWAAGNLVAVAEYVSSNHEPVLFNNPEDIYKGIHIRYSMDVEKVNQATQGLVQLISNINETRRKDS